MTREYNSVYSDELYHYGVLGMKWGVRHDRQRAAFTQTNRHRKIVKTLANKKEAKAQAKLKKRAGETYMKMLKDSNYLSQVISTTATRAKVEAGKDYTYSVTRNDKLGGVTVTVNGVSDVYVYSPNRKPR